MPYGIYRRAKESSDESQTNRDQYILSGMQPNGVVGWENTSYIYGHYSFEMAAAAATRTKEELNL